MVTYSLEAIPPEMTIFSPVTYEASSEAKKATAPLTSQEFPNLKKYSLYYINITLLCTNTK